MARAKQTKRAEARRRYRQTVAQTTGEAEVADAPESRGDSAAAPAPRPASQGRPSITAAFREAYHPAHVREDLRALPSLLTLAQPARIPFTRTVIGIPWFLVSAFLVIVGFVALLTSPTSLASGNPGASPLGTVGPAASVSGSTAATSGPTATAVPTAASSQADTSSPSATSGPSATAAPIAPQAPQAGVGSLLFQLLSEPPGGPTLPILLVGFMATRASYLQGFLIGLLDLALVGAYIAFGPNTGAQATVNLSDILVSAAITGLPTSVLFAAAAAWYRRFLMLSSPRRMQPAKGSSRGRSSGRPASRR